MRKILFFIILLGFITVCPLMAADFTIEARTDKTTVEFGESLILELVLSQDFRSGRVGQMPTINNIPGFDIANTSQSQSTRIINGVGTVQLITRYELVPQKEGVFEIPAFSFKDQNGNSASSNAIKITVNPPKPAAADDDDDEPAAANSPESSKNTNLFRAITIGAIIVLFIILIPFVYIFVTSGNVKKNTMWDQEVNQENVQKEIQHKVVKAVKIPSDNEKVSVESVENTPLVKVKRKEEHVKHEVKSKPINISNYDSGDYKMSANNPQLQKDIDKAGETIKKIRQEVGKVLVGQEDLLEFLILALVADGHILLEGVPGLAKTLAIKALARTVKTDFSRIQFTPDLLPADLIGTRIFNQKTFEFQTHKGPIFSNFVLADEINRAPAKVQSALLESMEERQVTIEHETFKLAEPFLVLATQNPIETEGTYTLSEAQVDRFLFKVIVNYPSLDEEKIIVKRMGLAEKSHQVSVVEPILEASDILHLRSLANEVYVDEKVVDYILRIVDATRNPLKYNLDLANYIRFGGSPRASINLTRAARAHAMVSGRTFVKPDDVKAVMTEVLRHRVIPTYEAEADDVDSDDIVETIKEGVPV